MDRIFIQIAAYRDPELVPTIKSLLSRAKRPERLTFGITWQHSKEDTWDDLYKYQSDNRFRVVDVNYTKSKGCCWARNLLQQQYNGEEYTLQLDSHHRFIQDWDEVLIKMYKGLQRDGISKPLITTYLPSYTIGEEPDFNQVVPCKMNFDRFIPEGAIFFKPAYIEGYENLTKPIPARFYSAHFAFTSGDFVKEVPHDPNYYFHGEEISIAVRAYTHGYDLYHPHVPIAVHEYTRDKRSKHWSDHQNWHLANTESHLRNRKLFEMDGLAKDIDFGIYDFGTVRSLRDYEKYAGISFKKRSILMSTGKHLNPPAPEMTDEAFEKALLRPFKEVFKIGKSQLPLNDYSFCVMAFFANGEEVYRQDINSSDIMPINRGREIEVWREFFVDEAPDMYILWPFSESSGWQQRKEYKIWKP